MHAPRSATIDRSRPTPADPADAHFRAPLPRGLRDVAHALSWDNFRATYACAGDIALESWTARAGHEGLVDYRATLAIGGRIVTLHESATGPIAAVTAMLHTLGKPLEIITMHHQRTSDGHTSFVLCESRGITSWGLGIDDSPESANVKAMISALNRLG